MRNLTLMTDLYQLTMMNGYYRSGIYNKQAVFDLFFRESQHFSYAVVAGIEQVTEYIKKLKFSTDDIAYLKGLNLFDDDFINYLKDMRFEGDIYAMPEGTIVYPTEPIMVVKGKLIQAQLIETALLNIINFQTLVATKASRVVQSAEGSKVIEFGLRRAYGADAGIYGARSAIIGGCDATSNVFAGKAFGLDVAGTHGHSFVMSFSSELTAFKRFAEVYPDKCILLVDTYDTLKSGVPNAIRVFDELKAKGHRAGGIRIDSGDLAYLSKKARIMLDNAGHTDATIFVSGDLDENVIQNLRLQGAKIDAYGVGTRLITGGDTSLGGVYKLSAIEGDDGELFPRMKISDSVIKITNPAFKTVHRIYDEQGKAYADLIALKEEKLPTPLVLTHPIERWKTSTLSVYSSRELLVPLFLQGKLVYKLPTIEEIKEYARAEKSAFWDEYMRNTLPHVYKVDLSDRLYQIRTDLLNKKQQSN